MYHWVCHFQRRPLLMMTESVMAAAASSASGKKKGDKIAAVFCFSEHHILWSPWLCWTRRNHLVFVALPARVHSEGQQDGAEQPATAIATGYKYSMNNHVYNYRVVTGSFDALT